MNNYLCHKELHIQTELKPTYPGCIRINLKRVGDNYFGDVVNVGGDTFAPLYYYSAICSICGEVEIEENDLLPMASGGVYIWSSCPKCGQPITYLIK